jgi:hypothetical protein
VKSLAANSCQFVFKWALPPRPAGSFFFPFFPLFFLPLLARAFRKKKKLVRKLSSFVDLSPRAAIIDPAVFLEQAFVPRFSPSSPPSPLFPSSLFPDTQLFP